MLHELAGIFLVVFLHSLLLFSVKHRSVSAVPVEDGKFHFLLKYLNVTNDAAEHISEKFP